MKQRSDAVFPEEALHELLVLDGAGNNRDPVDPTPCERSGRCLVTYEYDDVGLHLDTNFNYKIDGYIKLARALEPSSVRGRLTNSSIAAR